MAYYGTFAQPSYPDALKHVVKRHLDLMEWKGLPSTVHEIAFPVGLIFMRGDRAGDGGKIAEQAIASYNFWNADSGDSLDLIFAGWHIEDSTPKYRLEDFIELRKTFEQLCLWRYSGGTDIVLLNLHVNRDGRYGWFDLQQAICLPLEAMLREKMIDSLDEYIASLSVTSREMMLTEREKNGSPVWIISDRLAIDRVKNNFWIKLMKIVLRDYAPLLAGLQHEAVRDLSKDELHRPIYLD